MLGKTIVWEGSGITAYLLPFFLSVLAFGLVLFLVLPSKFKIQLRVGPKDISTATFVRPPMFPRYIFVLGRTWEGKVAGLMDSFVQVLLGVLKGGEKMQAKKPSLASTPVYRELISKMKSKISVHELSLSGRAGLDDASKTALLCGALKAAEGMIQRLQPRCGRWKIFVVPVYEHAYVALKGELLVKVSLLNVVRLMIFAKKSLAKG